MLARSQARVTQIAADGNNTSTAAIRRLALALLVRSPRMHKRKVATRDMMQLAQIRSTDWRIFTVDQMTRMVSSPAASFWT